MKRFIKTSLYALALLSAFAPASFAQNSGTNTAQNITQGVGQKIRLGCYGDSRCGNSSIFAGLATGVAYPQANMLGRGIQNWASFFSHGMITIDYGAGYYALFTNSVVKITLTANGSNYSSSPSISVAGCTGTYQANVVNGQILSVSILTQTAACTGANPAAVTITDSTGSGAAAFATISNGGSLGGPGENTTQILARLPDACSDGNNAELLIDGTNGVTTGESLATMEKNVTSTISGLINCGKFVVVMTQAPRSTSAITSAQQLQLYAFDNWLRKYVRQYEGINNTVTNVALLDPTPYWTDPTSTSGAAYTNCFYDAQTHPGSGCAMQAGWNLYQILAQKFGLTGYYNDTARTDLYDATNNVEGALATVPVIIATGGTVSAPCTGTLTSGYTLARSGSATTTCTASIEGPLTSTTRSDGLPGNRQVLTVSAGSGTSSEHYVVFSPQITLASLGVSTGDMLQASMDIELSSTTKFTDVALQMQCVDNSSVVWASTTSGTYGLYTDYFPDSTQANSFSTSRPFTLSTPISHPGPGNGLGTNTIPGAFVVPANCTKLALGFVFGIDASGGVASAGFTAKWTNPIVRKVLNP